MLSTCEYAPIVSCFTGWLTLVGNWIVTLLINFSGAQLILSAISLWNKDFVANGWQTLLMFWAVMGIAFTVNAFGVKYNYLDMLNKLCIYWTGVLVIVIMVTILVMSLLKSVAILFLLIFILLYLGGLMDRRSSSACFKHHTH